jgi:hypothetical protein
MKHLSAAYLRIFILGGILSVFLSNCSVLDPAEDIPSYLHIDAMKLSAVGNQGSSSSNITDAWVYMDGKLLGAFQLPCTIPILADGTHSFLVEGGVKMNGLAATRAIYPFWKGWEGDVTLTRTKVTTIGTPSVTYYPGTDFVWQENFDMSGLSIINNPHLSHIQMVQDTAGAFEIKSGHFHLNSDTTSFVIESSNPFPLPPTSDVYVEFDYRSNNSLTVGIEGPNDGTIPWLVLDPNPSWKKIYIRLTDILATYNPNGLTDYKIYFAMVKDVTVSQPYLYLDNIKLLK